MAGCFFPWQMPPRLTRPLDLQLKKFVNDDQATSGATAPNLSQAVSALPGPSGLAFLALGAGGLLAHRRRP